MSDFFSENNSNLKFQAIFENIRKNLVFGGKKYDIRFIYLYLRREIVRNLLR